MKWGGSAIFLLLVWRADPKGENSHKVKEMKKKLTILFFVIPLFISGCASTVTSPIVEGNTFISHNIPKLIIQVSEEFPFITTEKKHRSSIAASGSLASTGLLVEKYFFRDYARNRGLIIKMERFKGTGGKWQMMAPDYSSNPGIIVTGSTEMNGKQYRTGIYIRSKNNKQFINKAYGRTVGAKNNIRFQMFYYEELNISLPSAESLSNMEDDYIKTFVEEFSSRANDSFTILPYTATNTPSSKLQNKPQHTSKIKKKQFVEILEPDIVFTRGEVKFTVNRGDVLEVVTKKPCRTGTGECWIVRHVTSRESGAVSVKQMHSYHHVYTAFEPEIEDSSSQKKTRSRTYIEIREPDKISKGGKIFLITKGDKLEVLQRKICKSGKGECWAVRDLKTGTFGYVKASSMRSKHLVYDKTEIK